MIDAHAHLTDERFSGDIDAVLARASDAGVTRIVTCGEDVASSERAIALARASASVRAAVGIHPHRAPTFEERSLRRLRELASDPAVVAIGEIGIDLSGRSAPLIEQQRAFTAQLGLAADLDLPVCVHVRDAGDVVRALIDRGASRTGAPAPEARSPSRRPLRGYVHCYSEGPDEVDEWVRRGFLISLAGTVTFPRSDRLRAAAALIPDDRLLIETDAPYLAPRPLRGRRNEPAFVSATYADVARVRGVTTAHLAEQVRQNAASLFGVRWDRFAASVAARGDQ